MSYFEQNILRIITEEEKQGYSLYIGGSWTQWILNFSSHQSHLWGLVKDALPALMPSIYDSVDLGRPGIYPTWRIAAVQKN